MTSARCEEGPGTIPKKLAASSPLFFLAPWVLFCPLLSDWAYLRDGAEAGVWGLRTSPPSRELEGSPEMLAQCYAMMVSCEENQAGVGSRWVASSRASPALGLRSRYGSNGSWQAAGNQETRTSPSQRPGGKF